MAGDPVSSGSSGPSPEHLVQHFVADLLLPRAELNRVGSASISEITACRTSAADPLVVNRGQRFQVDLVHQLPVERELQPSWYSGFQTGLLAAVEFFFSSLCSQLALLLRVLLPLSIVENMAASSTSWRALILRENAGVISNARPARPFCRSKAHRTIAWRRFQSPCPVPPRCRAAGRALPRGAGKSNRWEDAGEHRAAE